MVVAAVTVQMRARGEFTIESEEERSSGWRGYQIENRRC
jgi:hypothetical protein